MWTECPIYNFIMELKNMLVANTLLGMAGGIQYLKLKKESRNPRKSQEKTLRSILEYAKDTVFGKEHDFAWVLEAADAKELFKRYRERCPQWTMKTIVLTWNATSTVRKASFSPANPSFMPQHQAPLRSPSGFLSPASISTTYMVR